MGELILLIQAALQIKNAIDGQGPAITAEQRAYVDAGATMIKFVREKIKTCEIIIGTK